MYMAAAVFLCLSMVGVYFYNRFVRLNQLMKEAYSGIDVQLKRRHDVIPNIVEAVKGYARHERGLFEDITKLRTQVKNVQSIEDTSRLENHLSKSIRNLFVVAENYPELKADANFRDLQSTLVGVEDDLQLARRYYNGTVRDFNILVESFPSNLMAWILGYKKNGYFEIEYATERNVPDVRF